MVPSGTTVIGGVPLWGIRCIHTQAKLLLNANAAGRARKSPIVWAGGAFTFGLRLQVNEKEMNRLAEIFKKQGG